MGWFKTRNGKIASIAAAALLLVGVSATAGAVSASVVVHRGSIGQFLDADGHRGPEGHGPDDRGGRFDGGPRPGDGPGFHSPDGDADHGPDFGPRPGPDGADDGQFKPPADGQMTPTPAPSAGSKS